MITFTIPGKPRAKGRPRMTKSGHTYTPKKTVEFENWVRCCWPGEPILEGPLWARITVTLAIPKSWPKKKREFSEAGLVWPDKRPDCDNIIKSILDALNGIAYHDDAQIVDVHCLKQYGAVDETRVTLGFCGAGIENGKD